MANDIFTFVMAVSTMMLPPPVSGVNASSRFPSHAKAGFNIMLPTAVPLRLAGLFFKAWRCLSTLNKV